MLVYEAISQIRDKINDKDIIEYTDDELLTNLKEALQFVSACLISSSSPMAVNDFIIESKQAELPKNYTKLAGKFPVKITGNKVIPLDEPPVKIRYFASNTNLKLCDEMPYNHEGIWQIAIKLASIYALNRNEFVVQQDKSLVDEFTQALNAIANS